MDNNNNKKSNGGKIAIIIICVVAGLLFLGFLLFIAIILLSALGITLFAINYINNMGVYLGTLNDEIYSYNEHVITNYAEYERIFGRYNFKGLTEEDFEENNYYIFSFNTNDCGSSDYKINSIKTNFSSKGVIDHYEVGLIHTASCGVCPESYVYYALKLDKMLNKSRSLILM